MYRASSKEYNLIQERDMELTPTHGLDLLLKTADGQALTSLQAEDILICEVSDQTLKVVRRGEPLIWASNGEIGVQVRCKDIVRSMDVLLLLLGLAAALCGVRLTKLPVAPVGEIRFKVEA